MLKILECIFALLSFVTLSSLWIFAGCSITYYSRVLLKKYNVRPNPWIYTAAFGVLLEIFLSFLSIITGSIYRNSSAAIIGGILSWLYEGSCYTAVFSPLTSIVGAAIGTRCRRAPYRYFI